MIGIAERGRRKKKALQKLFTLKQRSFTQVKSIAIEKIEYEIDDGRARDEFFAGRADMHALLKEFEIAQAGFVQRDDFAVDDCFACGETFGEWGEFGIALGNVDIVARAEREGVV